MVLTAPGIGWVGAHSAAALPGLARKLPHYGKYSYLAFTGTAPDIRIKGQWPVTRSPLARPLAEGGERPLELPPRTPLSATAAAQEG